MEYYRPADKFEVEKLVQWASAEEMPMEIIGRGSKRDLGRPVQANHVLSLSELKGVTLYEPEELVLRAGAGTPLNEIEQLLEENNQELAFEPMDTGSILEADSGKGTIGSVMACNLSGPRRLKVGAARDHVLGVEAVSGRGEIFKSGGRVVKNVTGYDLSKGLCGSWGTLSVITEITFKVLPRSETESTLVVRGLETEDAVKAMTSALGTSAEVSCAAYVPANLANAYGVEPIGGQGGSVTMLRIEGFQPSVEYRFDKLKSHLTDFGKIERFTAEKSRCAWKEVRDVKLFEFNERTVLWKVSVTPTDAVGFVGKLQDHAEMQFFLDWCGGLVWLVFQDAEPRDKLVRESVAKMGGHATLMKASVPERNAIPVFQPQSKELAALSMRLKEQFDPKGILNPGRMYLGT